MSICVAILLGSSGDRQYAPSPEKDQEKTRRYFEDGGCTVADIVEMKESSAMGYSPAAVIRALAGTPEGAEMLGELLSSVVRHEQHLKG